MGNTLPPKIRTSRPYIVIYKSSTWKWWTNTKPQKQENRKSEAEK